MNQRINPLSRQRPRRTAELSRGSVKRQTFDREPLERRRLKVPDALPIDETKKSPFKKITSAMFRKKVAIQEVVREPTSGGIIFRLTKDQKDIEILLIQDSKGR